MRKLLFGIPGVNSEFPYKKCIKLAQMISVQIMKSNYVVLKKEPQKQKHFLFSTICLKNSVKRHIVSDNELQRIKKGSRSSDEILYLTLFCLSVCLSFKEFNLRNCIRVRPLKVC